MHKPNMGTHKVSPSDKWSSISLRNSDALWLGEEPRAVLRQWLLIGIVRSVSNSKTVNMATWLFFILLLSTSKSFEGKTDLQSRHWNYASSNKASLFSAQNITSERKTPSQNGSKDIRCVNGPELLSSRLQSVLPPFAVTSKNVHNEHCKRDSERFLKHLNQLDLWALQMYDSSGKLPSGLLNGNVNQFGDFDQCINVHDPSLNLKGKYCLAYLQLQLQDQIKTISQAHRLMHSHFVFRSKLTDPGHRVPRFSTINWGLCVPSTCSSQDVQTHLKEIVDRYSNGTGFDVEVRVDSEMCQEKELFKVSTAFAIVSFLLLSIVVAAVVATVKDVFSPEESRCEISFWSVLNCFSLKRNGKALVDLSRSSDDIECVHGIRMINAFMLVLSHKSMALFFMPYSNRTSMVEKLNQQWTIIARIASLYTDSFIMISGLLSSYSLVKTLQKKGSLNLKQEYIGRLIRIIPPMAVIILVCTFILPELGSGPQWNLTVSHHADKCRKTWWKNFLFIHNYLGFENMCLTHTHHLGIDTQLFFVSPFLTYLLYKWPNYGVSVLIGAATASSVARYLATAERNLSFFIYPGISVSQMFDTANFSYIIPFHRLTAYAMGVLLGYVLRLWERKHKMKSHFLRFGWTITFSFLSYVLTKASEMNSPRYKYDKYEAATYAALAPIAWCLFVGWLVFVSHIGCGGLLECSRAKVLEWANPCRIMRVAVLGVLGRMMSSKYWMIWTRLSYAVYLTQFPIFFFNVGLQKYPQQYSFFLLVDVLEYMSVLIASVALTLLCDMPFSNLKKLIMPR